MHVGAAAPAQVHAAAPSAASPSASAALNKYCVSCHNERKPAAGLALDRISREEVGANAEAWEKVLRKLRSALMPPVGLPRPDRATQTAFVAWLETELERAAAEAPNPGRTETFHRLNRVEYQNAIRDLLALDIDVSSLLPADDSDQQHGFDNIAEVLSVSPTLFRRYLSTARQVSRLAVGLPPQGPVIQTYTTSQLLLQDERLSEDLPFGSRGGLAVHHRFPVDGEYVIKIRLQRNYVDYVRGIGEPHELDVRIDGVRVKRFTIGGKVPGRPAPASFAGNVAGSPEWEQYMPIADAGLEVRFAAKAGTWPVGISFVREMTEAEGVLQPRLSGFGLTVNENFHGHPAVEGVEIRGPYAVGGSGDTPSRRTIVVCQPDRHEQERSCAEKILSQLARRAYRRPATGDDLRTLLGFYDSGRKEGSFDTGIQFALERLLVDPEFLFRVERDPIKVAPAASYPVGDLSLASRLSFFLWSSIPDEALLDAAVRGKLKAADVLEQHARRLFLDARSSALVENFGGQWLYLRNIRDLKPDPTAFPEFDDNLRLALQQETLLFVESQWRDDRPIPELLTAGYTFLNERLARHYGIPNVYGERFRRVTLPDETRKGLLGKGAILAVTSYPNRTSPVLRGKWLLENILGTPPPPPPPNVPGLPDRGEGGTPASVRERLERHRKNPVCASCHAPMDPLGFALENFDAIGGWRTTGEAGTPIDASGVLPDGVRFEGPSELRALFASRREQFVSTVTEKLFSYALGRAITYHDLPLVRRIVREAAPGGYRWSSIVLGIVKSEAFTMRRSLPAGKSASSPKIAADRR
jgi:hypothetical protein